MNLKYYIRGIGVGILLTAVVMYIAFHSSAGQELSDTQIMEKAKELGMVEEKPVDSLSDLLTTATPTPTEIPTEDKTTDATDTTDTTDATDATDTTDTGTTATDLENNDSSASEPQDTDTKVGEDTTTENVPDKTDGDTPESDDAITGNSTDSGSTADIAITEGMTSEQVAKLLKSNNIIEDSGAFNQYLVINDYTRKIRIGNYEINQYATYKEIADIIIDK